MGSLRDKFSEITLAGVQEVLGTVNLLDNDITVGDIKRFMEERKLLLEEISDNNEKKYREMIDKYYIIKFTSTMVNSKECIYVVHLTDIDMLQKKFTCRSLTKYGMNYELKENDTIDFCDLINDSLRNVTEISRIKFHEILDAYRDLQILF